MADQKITVENLAADEDFQQWVLSPTPDLEQQWEVWLQERPRHKATVLQARQMVERLQIQGDQAPSELQQKVWELVQANIEADVKNQSSRFYAHKYRYWVAASLLLLLAASSIFVYIYQYSTKSYETAFGETKTIHLPDGSTVVLNANSSLRFAAEWEEKKLREVWLEGEAFFDVKQISLSTRDNSSMRLPFVVHSQNMEVEVLGTTFNVKDRQQYSEVVLNTGKVSVTPQQEQQAAPIAMEPGDRLAYSEGEKEWRIQQVNPEKLTAWRHQELIFDEMQLTDIALLLEETYGYTITFEEEEIKNYTFTGNIKTDEIELLMPMLEQSFGLEVIRSNKDIKFSKK